MIINRHNYQIWVTDYYDGRLDAFQKEVLMDFLDSNPDLKSEFEDYPGLSINPGNKEPFAYSGLLRSADQLSNEQIEHFSIALSEDDLDAEQRKEIMELGKSDPRFREYINTYERIKLEPANIRYPDKKELFKIPENRKRIKLIMLSVSAAASIAIIAGLFMLFSQESGSGLNSQLTADSGQENKQLHESVQDTPRQLPVKTDINIAEPVRAGEIIYAQTAGAPAKELSSIRPEAGNYLPGRTPEQATGIISITSAQAKEIISITPLAAKENIRLDIAQTHFLPAETGPYPASPKTGPNNMSVREYLAYQFRKQILADEDPDTENLKAWEIADAGVRGFNKVLGWEMELRAEQDPEGNIHNISFTSQLIRFDHKNKKTDSDL